ncbi:beta-glucan synthesis-associated [Nadsonia fulvescens var. elongata DSM 6958]|uniref:Beta-glucan synthesis-associated n=1 Tax=Nadsonia fulvescens var. elongata DSM 6958 TaxID=857566 RepID=A0A1E3PGU1_9ASCO|nr:beta-glucan synthesis-associated [Nadsonia fulvescens var. elongata DSM 6958]
MSSCKFCYGLLLTNVQVRKETRNLTGANRGASSVDYSSSSSDNQHSHDPHGRYSHDEEEGFYAHDSDSIDQPYENPFASENASPVRSSLFNNGQLLPPNNNAYGESLSSESPASSLQDYQYRNGKPYFGGNGYSNNSSARDLYSSSASLAGANGMVSSNFDRYPNRISSAAPSLSSAAAPLLRGAGDINNVNTRHAGTGGSPRTNSISDASVLSSNASEDNPFVVSADFSPFGGYPASSFPLHIEEKEADDYLHNPDPILDAKFDRKCHRLDRRGFFAVASLALLVVGAIGIFIILPVLTFTGKASPHGQVKPTTYEILSNYQYSTLGALRTNLVDEDTPTEALTREAKDGADWVLVFSDEFNKEGRTFYENDDQFWTAVDIHYAATQDLEWYDPDAATTSEGTLKLTLDAFKNHDLFYRSGMLQSWNKMCFTQGIIEISAKLPGRGDVLGLWPGLWTMGNLGRPGYLSTTDGVWPYCYDSCDAGITANQSSPDGISYLPGQRLNKCTCSGEEHPNPGVGRGAPEIDALEGANSDKVFTGTASQSAQIAPFDIWYMPDYEFIEIHNKSVTAMNTYAGGPFQQAISGVTILNNSWYAESQEKYYQKYAYEYLNDDQNGYLRWFVGDDPTFTLYPQALGPNGNIGQRSISKEPMSIIMNLGLSNSWTWINWLALKFPYQLEIDYVRIYQPKDQVSITCDPDDYPTFDYIEEHMNAYQNPNFTHWTDAGYAFPKNTLTSNCKA